MPIPPGSATAPGKLPGDQQRPCMAAFSGSTVAARAAFESNLPFAHDTISRIDRQLGEGMVAGMMFKGACSKEGEMTEARIRIQNEKKPDIAVQASQDATKGVQAPNLGKVAQTMDARAKQLQASMTPNSPMGRG